MTVNNCSKEPLAYVGMMNVEGIWRYMKIVCYKWEMNSSGMGGGEADKPKWISKTHFESSDISLRLCCCCCSVSKSCLTLCDPMDCRMPGSSVLYYLLEFAQIHVQ